LVLAARVLQAAVILNLELSQPQLAAVQAVITLLLHHQAVQVAVEEDQDLLGLAQVGQAVKVMLAALIT
jgi:hypothetical protein